MVLSVTDYSQPFNLKIQDLACLILAEKLDTRSSLQIFRQKNYALLILVFRGYLLKEGKNGIVDFERPDFL